MSLTEREPEDHRSSPLEKGLLWLAVALALYVLSTGPVTAILMRIDFSETIWTAAQKFYKPLQIYRPVALRVWEYESWWDPKLENWGTKPYPVTLMYFSPGCPVPPLVPPAP